MFHAVRHWFVSGRVRVSSRLFLFELSVVILGVLIAQWLQQKSQAADLAERARVHLEAVMPRYAAIAGTMLHYERYGDCMSKRALEVARIAASGGTADSRSIGRPALPAEPAIPWDNDVRRAAARSIGPERMKAIQDLDASRTTMEDAIIEVAQDWASFRLLDPANGTPSELDRATVRLAAIRIVDRLRLLHFKHDENAANVRLLGLPSAPSLPPSVIDGCGMIRNWQPS